MFLSIGVVFYRKNDLYKAICNIYGQEVKANIYLQKFINIETILPDKVKGPNGVSSKSAQNEIYINFLADKFGVENFDESENIALCMEELVTHFNFLLRQIEKAFINLTLFYIAIYNEVKRPRPFISFLAVIKVAIP